MIEETITNIVLWLKLFVETTGALLIGVGAILTAVSCQLSVGGSTT